MSVILKVSFCCAILLTCSRPASAQRSAAADPCGDPAVESSMWAAISGEVVKVEDGDTITISVRGGGVRRIDLAGIDAPEGGGPFGAAARRLLERLVGGRSVEVWVKTAWMGRMPAAMAGVVHLREVGMLDVNLLMIQSGLARHKGSEPYSMSNYTECHYVKEEEGARNARRGLWRAAP